MYLFIVIPLISVVLLGLLKLATVNITKEFDAPLTKAFIVNPRLVIAQEEVLAVAGVLKEHLLVVVLGEKEAVYPEEGKATTK